MGTRARTRLTLVACATAFMAGAAMFAAGAFIPAKAALGQFLLARAWDDALSGQDAPRPWPWADTWPVAKVHAHRLDASAIVLADATGEAMAWGPAHVRASAAPGAPGVSVIAAHRDTHFAFLKDLLVGDTVSVTDQNGVVHHYVVNGFEVVNWDRSGIAVGRGDARLALVTCWPFDALSPGQLRLIAWADMVDTDKKALRRGATKGES